MWVVDPNKWAPLVSLITIAYWYASRLRIETRDYNGIFCKYMHSKNWSTE
jgi:hypothetical protein